MKWAVSVLAVAGVNYVAGRLGLLLAIPPGFATPVWPPSGVALAALLLFGLRLWPGVWLASFAINLFIAPDVEGELIRSSIVAAGIATGSTLQAVIGTILIRRFVGFPDPLVRERSIAGFLLLGGPVSCTVAASVGVAVLFSAGAIPLPSVFFTWWTWWVGDTIGALLFAPLLVVLALEPRGLASQRALHVGVPLVLTFAVSVVFFFDASGRERERLKAAFEARGTVLTLALERRLASDLEVLESLRRFFIAAPGANPEAFREFVLPALEMHPTIQGLGWNPKVADSERAAWERSSPCTASVVISERSASGEVRAAAQRPTYVPACFLEPIEGNRRALGFDLLSNPQRAAAVAAAFESGQAAATAPIQLVQDETSQSGILVVAPVLDALQEPALDAPGRAAFRGVVVGVFRVGDLVREALSGYQSEGTVLRLLDVSDGGQLLARLGDASGFDATSVALVPLFVRSFDVAGRRWRVEWAPTMAYLAANQGWQSWVVLTAGLSFASLLGALLLVSTGRAALVAEQVEVATRALTQEVAERTRAEARFASLIAAAPDAMVIVNDAGTIVIANTQAEKLFGYSSEELVGRPVETLVPERLRGDHQSHRAGYLATSRVRPMGEGLELFARRADASVVPVEISLSPLETDEGTLVMAAIRDITERKKTEQDLARYAADLERSNRDLDEFAHVASHDLQAPLRKISIFGGRLARRLKATLEQEPEAADSLARMQNAARRMSLLVRDLLELSRVSRSDVEFESVDLDAMLAGVLSDLEAEIEEAGATVEVDALGTIDGEATLLRQLFQNLLSNAIKYRREGVAPVVRVRGRRVEAKGAEAQRCEVQVEDNGIGFDPSSGEAMFQPFTRLVSREEFEGTGVGLALCRKVVERHRGEIRATGELGKGAIFTVVLPTKASA